MNHTARGHGPLDPRFHGDDVENMRKLLEALGNVLCDPKLDAAFKAMVFALPTESELGLALRAEGKLIDLDPIYAARKKLLLAIATTLRGDFEKVHKSLAGLSPKATDGTSMGKRSLKNLCLHYLAATRDKKTLEQVYRQSLSTANMTDRAAALGILVDADSPLRAKALAKFEKDWKKVPAVMDTWFSVQASAKRKDVLQSVKMLMKRPYYDIKNPNRFSALFAVFAANGLGFHAKNGSGYRFAADLILKIDPINQHSSSTLAKAFTRWKDYDLKRQKLMQAELKRLAKAKKLSPNVREIVTKSLKA